MIEDGIFTCRTIDIRLAPYDWPFPLVHARSIEKVWTARRLAKPQLFDGRVLLMRDLLRDLDHLTGTCFEASYKSFLHGREIGFPGEPVVNLFAMAALLSSDGAYMLGEMNEGTASAGALYFPAGTPEPEDLDAAGRVGLEANLLRELEEETGLAPSEVAVAPEWTVVVHLPKVACMRIVRSSESAANLQARLDLFNASQAHPELRRLVPVFSARDYDHDRMPPFMVHYLDHALCDTPRHAR